MQYTNNQRFWRAAIATVVMGVLITLGAKFAIGIADNHEHEIETNNASAACSVKYKFKNTSVQVVEFYPKNAPNMMCIETSRGLDCFKKENTNDCN